MDMVMEARGPRYMQRGSRPFISAPGPSSDATLAMQCPMPEYGSTPSASAT